MGRDGQEVMRDPLLRKAFFGAFLNFHVWMLTAALGFLASWVWATDDAVKAQRQEIEHRAAIIEAIPEIQRDVEVLKEKAVQQEKAATAANHKLDKITDLLLNDRHNGGR